MEKHQSREAAEGQIAQFLLSASSLLLFLIVQILVEASWQGGLIDAAYRCQPPRAQCRTEGLGGGASRD